MTAMLHPASPLVEKTARAMKEEARRRLHPVSHPAKPDSKPSPRFRQEELRGEAPSKEAQEPEKEELCNVLGTAVKIVYRKPESLWSIVRVRIEEEVVWAKGELTMLQVGAFYQLGGVWEEDSRWGRGLRVRFHREIIPTDNAQLFTYLVGLRLPRLTSALCKQIVERWGLQSLQILEIDPLQLTALGLHPDACLQLQRSWCKRLPSRSLLATPESWGLNEEQARSLFDHYGGPTLKLLQRNPYHLLGGSGISFSVAEQVAERVGIERQDPRRVRAAILSILEDASRSEGHTALPRQELFARTRSARLQIETQNGEQMLQEMEDGGELLSDPSGHFLGLPRLMKQEHEIAEKLLQLTALPALQTPTAPPPHLTREQALAVVAAQQHRCLVLTGYPGTGKTFTLRSILDCGWEKPLLTAPTGKAAKRLSELTERPAFTLHRLLEYNPSSNQFGRGTERPLDADLVVVDEAAMLDVPLAAALVRSIDFSQTTLLLCGDANQLPPVGPGNFLFDVIHSRCIPVVKLQQIVRQDDKSQIIPNAKRVLEGEPILVDNARYKDFKYIPVDASTQLLEQRNILKALNGVFKKLRDQGIPAQDIQLLTPMKKGEVPGAHALNKMLQQVFNPRHRHKPEIQSHQTFRLGDRVIQLRNDYEKGVFNGDTGIVQEVSGQHLKVLFDERLVEYESTNLSQLELSYAISIHKSQGSEWPVVILPMSLTHRNMFTRKLLYTAMTRAKKLVILVGCTRAIAYAISEDDAEERTTTLQAWLKELKAKEKED